MEKMLTKPIANFFAARRGLLLFAMMLSTLWTMAAPPAYFTVSPNTGCAPLLVQCFNASGIGTYDWDFGDTASGPADTSHACSPAHVFNHPGTYTIKLVVSGTSTHTEIVTVLPGPRPVISGVLGACAGSTQLYSVPFVTGSSWSWTVTGGTYYTLGSGNSINVTWVTAGMQDISVTETNAAGCKNTTVIHVQVSAKPDLAQSMPCRRKDGTVSTRAIPFDSGSTVSCICPNSTMTYTMPSTGNTYTWYVTGGTIVSIGPRGETVTIKWGHSGTVTLTIVETSPYGCKDSETCTFTICPGPTASFSAPTVCIGVATSFTDLSTSPSGISRYSWDFGDGGTSTLSNPSHTYAAAGTYNVKLTITDSKGCTDDTIVPVTVTPGTGPKIYCISSVCAGSKANYSTLSIPGATYSWSVLGDSTDTASSNTISVLWGAGPVGTIKLTVSGTSYYSCPTPTTAIIPILPSTPPITGPLSVCVGPTYTYTAPMVPGSVYSWTVTGAVTYSFTDNVLTVIWDPSATGTITVKMKNELLCCEGTNTITVTKKPDLNIIGIMTVCAGTGGYTYTLTGGISGDWTVTGGTVTSGSTLGVPSITVTWGPAGTGMISATVASTAYCSSTASVSVSIIAPPDPVTITGPDPVCFPSGISTYTATVASGTTSSIWSLAAGGIMGPQTPTSCDINWTTPGVWTLTLKQMNTSGCVTINTFAVTVVDHSVPPIIGPLSACVNDIKTYTFTSSLPASLFDWSITGGIILSGMGTNTLTVQWGYSAPGTVTLTNLVCGTSMTINVTVMDIPVVTIDSVGISCTSTFFDLVAHTAPGNTISWSTGSTVPPAHITGPGVYTVTVTNLAGCSKTVIVNLATIPTWPHPVATITKTPLLPTPGPLYIRFCAPYVPGNIYLWSTGETSPCIDVLSTDSLPRTVTVTNSYGCISTATDSNLQSHGTGGGGGGVICMTHSCPVGGVVTLSTSSGTGYLWSTGATTSSITITLPGTYSVTYTDYLGNPQSCSYTYLGPPPPPNFSFSFPACNPVTFTNTTVTTMPTHYYWDFGDGTHSTDSNPTHTYTSPGLYHVILYASLDGECWATRTRNVNISVVITADWTWSAGCTPLVNFASTVSTLPAGPVSYFWDFGDPTSGSPTSTLPNPIHMFTSGGYFTVTMTVTSGSCSTTVVKTILVPELRALFSTCGAGCLNQSTQVMDMSIHTSPIVSWFWDFGNGNTSTLQNPWNIYTLVGTYTASLTVTDSRGCVSTFTVPITVYPLPTVAIVATSDTIFCSGDSVRLKATPGYDYIWSTGETTVDITVRTTGLYWCTIIDPVSGCRQKIGPIHVIVHPAPRAVITVIGSLTICEGDVTILSAPSGVGYTYAWYKNGTHISLPITQDNLVLSGSWDAGIYTLVVYNGYGCKDSSGPDTLVVKGGPAVGITASPGWLCKHSSSTLSYYLMTGGPIVSTLWSNGATTATTTVSLPGLYSVTVTNSNGCSYTTYYNLPKAPSADFDQLPKGCYKICPGTSATLTLPWGFSYNWYNGSTLVATGTSYTITSAGSYWVTATNMTYPTCTDTSDTFSVTVVPGPTVHITGSGPLVLCESSSGSLTLTASGTSGVTYVWSTGATGSSIVVTHPGKYWVTVHSSVCCVGSDTVTVDSANCCFPPGEIFTTIPDSTVISSDAVWNGKYYVAGKVHITGNSTFDLTGIDVIFSPTGEFIFHDSTTIRANNSVFRPCRIDGTWVGFTFLDKSKGLVHTNTYKNADIAINVTSTGNYSVKLVDNTFSQCHTAVYIDKSTGMYTEGITGNSFVVDDTKLPFSSDDYFGIQLYNTDMQEVISQNSFRNATKVGQYKNVYGIFVMGTSTTISTNTFTNMHRSVDVESPVNYLSIENNTIEITQSSTPNDYQIRVGNSGVPVIVYNNQVWNSIPNPAKTAAIYGENSYLLNITQNQIKGFSFGVELQGVRKSQVLENNISGTKLIGIYYYDGDSTTMSDVDIACNEIDMDLVPEIEFSSTPIGIATDFADKLTKIRGNCVSNTSIAIQLSSPDNEPILLVRNNFMYNYAFYGVYNLGHVGDIGSASPPFSLAGRNTFASNNVSALDIYSSVPLTEAGNYGVNFTNALVSSTGVANLYSSTANCAKQINLANPTDVKMDDIAICDHFDEILYPYLEQLTPGEFSLAPTFREHLSKLANNATALETVSSVLTTIAAKGSMDQANTFYSAVTSAGILSGNASQWFNYRYAYLNTDYAKARTLLNSIMPATADETDLKNIETVRITQLISGKDVKRLGGPDKSLLGSIDDRRGRYAAPARDMLQMNQSRHDYIFSQPRIPRVQAPQPGKVIDRRNEYLVVFPNPANERLTVRYSIQNAENHSFRIVNALGQDMQNIQVMYNAADIQLDISHLSIGVYYIFLTDGKEQHRASFVKN
jgi:PKD repeat protein